METALERLRTGLEQHLIDRGSARLWALRGQATALGYEERRRVEFLRSEHASTALLEVAHCGDLPPAALQRLRDHHAGALYELDTAPAGARFARALARPTGPEQWLPARRLEYLSCTEVAADRERHLHKLGQALASEAQALLAASWRAERAYRARGGTVTSDVERHRCQVFLDGTSAPAGELMAFVARSGNGSALQALSAALNGVRAPALDAVFSARGRKRRMMAVGSMLGLARLMRRALRREADSIGLWPGQVLLLAVPGDIRIVEGLLSGGPHAELASLWAVGSALAAALVHRQLPFEDRWPLPDGVVSVLGGLAMQWLPDRVFLKRIYGLSGKALERAQRAATAAALWTIRLSCHWACQTEQLAENPFGEGGLAALGEAALVKSTPETAWLLAVGPRVAHARATGQLAGLRLHVALRERFDEDYFRNPRFAELLLGAAARGNTLGAVGLCSELGVSDKDDIERVLEWM